MPYDIPDMYSKPGTPCNDYNGYCDVFQRCREVCILNFLLVFDKKMYDMQCSIIKLKNHKKNKN